MRGILVSTFLLVVMSALAALPAQGTAPGKNGQIAFQHAGKSLWLINPDGTGERQLTDFKGAEDENPDWSPNGSTIAFDRCSSHCEIWTVKADGTASKRLGPNCLHKAGDCIDRAVPAWAPNGKAIASGAGWGPVKSDNHAFNEIIVLNPRGGGVRQLTHITTSKPFSVDVNRPMWSPDGKQIAFEVQKLSSTGESLNQRALFIVNSDGSGLLQLTPWDLDAGDRPDWSPDGTLILFRVISAAHKLHGNLYTIRPDGSGLKQLTNYSAPKAVLSGSFSPDGNWITFSRFSGTSAYPAIFVMRADGSNVQQVTRTNRSTHRQPIDFQPDWGPRLR